MHSRRVMSGDQMATLKAKVVNKVPKDPTGRSQDRPDNSRYAHACDFKNLPGYSEIELQRKAGEIVGVANPFYRLHEGKSGARARIDGRDCLNFASYDYLGLNGDQRLTSAVSAAAGKWGTSASASRLTGGERPAHRELEDKLANLYETEAALVFVSGHATNVSVIASLSSERDLVVHDAYAHNSIIAGCQLSEARRLSFPHNDLDALEAILERNRDRHQRCLIVVEGLYSMDGDGPDLEKLIDIKKRWGCWLMVDEAHSLGVLGKTGRGIAEHLDLPYREVDIWMGTLSKTLCSCGGYVAGAEALIDYLRFKAPGMVYSVGLPVPATVAASTALDIMLSEPDRVERLRQNGKTFDRLTREAGLDTAESWGQAVVPIMIGDSVQAVMLAQWLLERGINALPIIPPAVQNSSARLRFFLSSEHRDNELEDAVRNLAEGFEIVKEKEISVASLAREHGY